MKDALGNRMKAYERNYKIMIPKKHPVIIRLDGKAFHTLTRGMDKPFDKKFIFIMKTVAHFLFNEIQNCKAAFVQSDEISLLLDDRATLETDAWFGNNLQKLVSISASMATMHFNWLFISEFPDKLGKGMFDARAFILPDEDVPNYFIWRQRDWNRNSIQMLARSQFSAKELHKKNTTDMHEMLHEKDINWSKLDGHLKNGTLFLKDNVFTDKFDYDKFKELIKGVEDE